MDQTPQPDVRISRKVERQVAVEPILKVGLYPPTDSHELGCAWREVTTPLV